MAFDKTNRIPSLTPRHFKIVDLSVQGLTCQQIAKKLSMSPSYISIITNSPTFKHEFALRRAVYEERSLNKQIEEEDIVSKSLKAGAIHAARKLVGHIDSPEDSISVKSCAEVLDRAGYGRKIDKATAPAGPTIIINSKDASRIVESITLDSEPVILSESSDRPPVDS